MSEESNFKVPLTKVLEILPHTNAERLEFVKVYGFSVVVQKGRFQVGDLVYYIPIDSVLSEELEKLLFGPESKIKLNKGRVKQIKIRSLYSQGMVVAPKEVESIVKSPLKEEEDYAERLGVTKYSPPVPSFQAASGPKLRNKPYSNPYFRCYNGVTNILWNPYAFKDGEEVILQSKLHGSHIRWSKAPFSANTLWKKIVKLFGFAPKFEFCIGSNNIELTNRKNYVGFYGEDVYSKTAKRLDVMSKTKDGEFWHGELIGEGIQKGYSYGHKELHIVVFDCRVLQEDGTQRWLDPEETEALAKERGFDFVPVVYRGPYSKEIVDFHTSDVEVYYPKDVREGIVAKARYGYDDHQSKRAYKSINKKYLAGDQSDFT